MTRFGTALRATLATLALIALPGCLDIRATFFVDSSGMLGIEGDVKLQPELDDVLQALEAAVALDSEGRRFVGNGICGVFERTAASDDHGRKHELKARNYKVGNRPACSFSVKLGPAGEILDNVARELAGLKEKVGFELTYEGTRRYRVTVDLGALHAADLAFMREAIVKGFEELQARTGLSGSHGPPPASAIDRAMRKYTPMMVALMKMAVRGGEADRIDLGVRAPRIVATNLRQDGNTARFSFSWGELIALEQSPEAKKQHVYVVVFEF